MCVCVCVVCVVCAYFLPLIPPLSTLTSFCLSVFLPLSFVSLLLSVSLSVSFSSCLFLFLSLSPPVSFSSCLFLFLSLSASFCLLSASCAVICLSLLQEGIASFLARASPMERAVVQHLFSSVAHHMRVARPSSRRPSSRSATHLPPAGLSRTPSRAGSASDSNSITSPTSPSTKPAWKH